MKTRYIYFVSYYAVVKSGMTQYHGNIQITSDHPINHWADLEEIKETIRQQGPRLGDIVILNFIFLRKEKVASR